MGTCLHDPMRSISSAKVLISFDILKSSPSVTPELSLLRLAPYSAVEGAHFVAFEDRKQRGGQRSRCLSGSRRSGDRPHRPDCLTHTETSVAQMYHLHGSGLSHRVSFYLFLTESVGYSYGIKTTPLTIARHLWSVKRNSSPPSGQCLRACICPPWRRIAFRTMLSPSPEPPRSRVRPESMR